MRLESPMSRNQYRAASLAGIESLPTVEFTGEGHNWVIHWDSSMTPDILDTLKNKEPKHEVISIPYKSLRARLTIVWRDKRMVNHAG